MIKMDKSREWKGEQPLVAPDHGPLAQLSFLYLPRKAESGSFKCAQHVQHVPGSNIWAAATPGCLKRQAFPSDEAWTEFKFQQFSEGGCGGQKNGYRNWGGGASFTRVILSQREATSLQDWFPLLVCNDSGNPTALGFFLSRVCHHHWDSSWARAKGKLEKSCLPFCDPTSAVWLWASCSTSLSSDFLISQTGAILPNWQGPGEWDMSQSFENWASQHMLLLFPSAYPSISSLKELEFQPASSWI